MQYNDALIQYDQSNVNYEGMWSITINETSSFSESFPISIRAFFSEIVSMVDTYPLYSRYDDAAIQYDEATAKYDHYVEADASLKTIGTIISESIAITESISRAIGIAISESITVTESLYRTIRMTISETITITEVYGILFRLTISETITMAESMTFNIYERLKGILGMIKEFVRVSDKKEKVSAINVLEGVREQLNVIERQYDESTLMYDEADVCYNNYISSEKPLFVLGKKNAQVSISNQKDKPIISKR